MQLMHKCASIFRNIRSPFGYNFVGRTIRRVGRYEKASERKRTKKVRRFLVGALIHCLWQRALVASDSD